MACWWGWCDGGSAACLLPSRAWLTFGVRAVKGCLCSAVAELPGAFKEVRCGYIGSYSLRLVHCWIIAWHILLRLRPPIDLAGFLNRNRAATWHTLLSLGFFPLLLGPLIVLSLVCSVDRLVGLAHTAVLSAGLVRLCPPGHGGLTCTLKGGGYSLCTRHTLRRTLRHTLLIVGKWRGPCTDCPCVSTQGDFTSVRPHHGDFTLRWLKGCAWVFHHNPSGRHGRVCMAAAVVTRLCCAVFCL